MEADASKLDRYRLETRFDGDNVVIHTIYKTDLDTGMRKTPTQEKWRQKNEIGVGGFGAVWLEEEEGGQLRAVKMLRRTRNIDYSRELSTLAKLNDRPDLFVHFIGWYEDRHFTFIAMEYIRHGDLSHYIKTPGARPNAREITRQLLEGLVILHERKICHRDLKPQNVLIASLQPIWVKIADFGVSKREKGTFLHTTAGTPGYCAPEILRLLPQESRTQNLYTNAVDMWALGCLVHEILTSEIPFLETPFSNIDLDSDMSGLDLPERQTDMEVLSKFCSGGIDLPVRVLQDSGASSNEIDFLKKLLVPHPHRRVAAKDALRIPWLLEVFCQDSGENQSSIGTINEGLSYQIPQSTEGVSETRNDLGLSTGEVLLAIPIPRLVDLCIQYGQSIIRKYESFRSPGNELEDLKMQAKAYWSNLELNIQIFVKSSEYIQRHIQLCFEKLVSTLFVKLQLMNSETETTSAWKKLFRRAKPKLLARERLTAAITIFKKYDDLLQPLLLLLPRNTDPRAEDAGSNRPASVVQTLKLAFKAMKPGGPESVAFFPDERFQYDRQLVQYTSVEIKRLSGGDGDIIIDSIPCEGPGAVNIVRDVRGLASILGNVVPITFGIPVCAGLVKVKDPTGRIRKLEMVFNVPKGLENPRSLRSILLHPPSDPENGKYPIKVLSARIELAKLLARSLFLVHSANFVHKNFRPESIIVFDCCGGLKNITYEIGFPILVGFRRIRLVDGLTAYMGDNEWEQNIYRHPSRQGQFPEEAYNMGHDIYSLGVCLLEIALWKSFVLWDVNGQYPSLSVGSENFLRGSITAFEIKEKLVAMSREIVPGILGNRYAEVTTSCLECLDEDSGEDSGSLDENLASFGVSYIEKVS